MLQDGWVVVVVQRHADCKGIASARVCLIVLHSSCSHLTCATQCVTHPLQLLLASGRAEAPRPHVLVSLLGSVYVRQVHQEQQQDEQQEQVPNGKPQQGGAS